MKSIFVDTNIVNEDKSLQVHDIVAKNLMLQHGEKMIAYQEGESWEAEAVWNDGCWGIKLLSDAKTISQERQEGHIEGFWFGYYLQSIRMVCALEKLSYSKEEIEKIKDSMGIK